MIKCEYYFDVLSQWCYIAEFALTRLLLVEGGNVEVSFLPVPIDAKELPSREEQLRVYRRSHMISGIETQAWITADAPPDTWSANAAVLAAPYLRSDIDFQTVRLRVGEAALLRGVPLANPDEAVKFVSNEFALDPAHLREALRSEEITSQLQANRAAFLAAGLTVRPSFVMRNGIGDHIVLGGQYDFGILNAAVQSLRADEASYERFENSLP